MAWTYDLSTNVGKVRLLTTDNDWDNQVFEDAEIQAFLDMQGDIYQAAEAVCVTWAQSRSKIDKTIRLPDGTMATRYTSQELIALAKSIRQMSVSNRFGMSTMDNSTAGDTLDSYRPDWRNIDDLPVIE